MLLLLSLLALVLSQGAYVPPVAGDQRSPCPALNVLANHGELPHTGWFSRDGLNAAVEENLGLCAEASDVFFQMSYTVPSAKVAGAYPFPASWIFTLAALQTPPAGEHDASISRVDRKEGNATLYNYALFSQFVNAFAYNGTVNLTGLLYMHGATVQRSNNVNNRTLSAVEDGLGVLQMLLIYFTFDQKPIPTNDLITFFNGSFPAGWQPPTPWCTKELITKLFEVVNKLSTSVGVPELYFYQFCKGILLPGVETTMCEDAFPHAYPPVDPLDWNGVDYPDPVQNDVFEAIWPLSVQYPSKSSDTGCALNDTELFAARQATLRQYYVALQAVTYDELEALARPLFVDSNETAIHQAAAGDYYGVEEIIEYLTVAIPSLNGGYVYFSQAVIDPTSVVNVPANSTIMSKVSNTVAFDCYKFPTPADPDGACRTPVLKGSGGAMYTFESCSAKITQYLTNFNEWTNEGAVRASSIWDTCWKAMAYCNGTYAIYDSFQDCITYMQQIPRVSCKTSVLRGNTTVCRGLHAFLAHHRPDLHCEHISRTSMVCSDDHCDEVICPSTYSREDFHWGPVDPYTCAGTSPEPQPACDGAGSLVASFLLPLVLSVPFIY